MDGRCVSGRPGPKTVPPATVPPAAAAQAKQLSGSAAKGMVRPFLRIAAIALPLAAGAGHGGEPVAPPPQRSAWFGDLHVHTMYSFDAFLGKNLRNTPDDAYRYAKGEAIPHPRGGQVELSGPPLDFLAVTDHAEFMGAALALIDIANRGPQGYPVIEAARRAMGRLVRSSRMEEVTRDAWQRTIEAAERHNEPGKFTSFIGYEYTATPRVVLHRNVIFESADVPALPFSAEDSTNPEDLWSWLDRQRAMGIEALAIPHSMDRSKASRGPTAFPETTWENQPIDRAFAEKRMRNEPVVEIIQEKGASETHPLLSPHDEWAGFQLFRRYNGTPPPVGDYWRKGLNLGLVFERRIGVNPYRLGAAGGSDSHLGAGSFDESDFFKTAGPQGRGSVYPDALGGWEGYRTRHIASHGTAGLTGIWAEENTRTALFQALRRRETFATSGPRLRVRFFGGFGLARRIGQSQDPVATGYTYGVPMGGVLTGAAGAAPSFLVWAMRDPLSGRLQRAQIVKGWLEGGEPRERVFDVACSDGLEPAAQSRRCPDNGARVDPADCSVSRDRGSVELRTVWTDPDFDATEPAWYYVRVLENPSCRWSTWDAVRAGIEPNPVLPPVVQERAWSSPVWFVPDPAPHSYRKAKES